MIYQFLNFVINFETLKIWDVIGKMLRIFQKYPNEYPKSVQILKKYQEIFEEILSNVEKSSQKYFHQCSNRNAKLRHKVINWVPKRKFNLLKIIFEISQQFLQILEFLTFMRNSERFKILILNIYYMIAKAEKTWEAMCQILRNNKRYR